MLILILRWYSPGFQHTLAALGPQFSSLSFAVLATHRSVFSWQSKLVFQVRRTADNNNCNANDAGRRRMRATLAFLSVALGAQSPCPFPFHLPSRHLWNFNCAKSSGTERPLQLQLMRWAGMGMAENDVEWWLVGGACKWEHIAWWW